MRVKRKRWLSAWIRAVSLTFFGGLSVGGWKRREISKMNISSTEVSTGNTTTAIEYSLARLDSFGFFTSIRNEDWVKQRERARRSYREPTTTRSSRWVGGTGNVALWIDQNYPPIFTCPHEEMVGRLNDGHKFVCDPIELLQYKDCLVYSVGSNNDFSFEAGLKQLAPFCDIHIFDFGDFEESMKTEWNLTSVHYHKYGLTGRFTFWPEGNGTTKSFPRIVKELGHQNRRIDILKLDCEFCEWDTYQDILRAPNHISQLLIETHQINARVFPRLHKAGYVLFHKEPNMKWREGCEWSFLKLAKTFWTD